MVVSGVCWGGSRGKLRESPGKIAGNLVARVIRNAIRANRFARIIRNWTPFHFNSASGRFARITRISNSRESPDSRESCESIRANHATKAGKILPESQFWDFGHRDKQTCREPGNCPHLPCGMFFEIDNSSLLKLFWLRGQITNANLRLFLRVDAVLGVSCENFRFSANSRASHVLCFLGQGKNLQKSAKICVRARFVPLNLSP